MAGWRGEVNVPGLTQVRPDLLVQVSDGTLGAGNPLHRIRAPGGSTLPGGGEAPALPADGGGGQAAAPADGVRDGAGPAELPGRRRGAADAHGHPGAGAGRAGDRSGYGVEPER